MFVTRREILNRYCEWLFHFLIEAAEIIDVRNVIYIVQELLVFRRADVDSLAYETGI